MSDKRPHRLLWHPHQKLWNRRLAASCRTHFGRGVMGDALIAAIVAADTVILTAVVAGRRVSRLRRLDCAGSGVVETSKPRILYIDCGLHKQAAQVRQMHEWFGSRFDLHILGFEASPTHMRDAAAALADIKHLTLAQVALVGPTFSEAEVRLYHSGDEGAGDSLFGERGEEFDLVPARRLTEVVAAAGLSLTTTPVILRMNIEGAERYVIEDLIDDGAHGLVDGFYGMWDDLSKIDPAADSDFRRTLRKHRISTITFNDRDLNPRFLSGKAERRENIAARLATLLFRLRQKAIRLDIETSIRVGQAKAHSNPHGHI